MFSEHSFCSSHSLSHPIFIHWQSIYTLLTCNFCFQKQQIKFEQNCYVHRGGKAISAPAVLPSPLAQSTGYCNRCVAGGRVAKGNQKETDARCWIWAVWFCKQSDTNWGRNSSGTGRKLEDWKHSTNLSPIQMVFLINLSDAYERR